MKRQRVLFVFFVLACSLVMAAAFLWGCGKKETPKGENLLSNASFEEVSNGVPVGWTVRTFRGTDRDVSAEWGIDDTRAYEGKKSFYFQATRATRRFFTLSQSIDVKNVARVRVRGAIRTLDVVRNLGQYAQANFDLTCYDENGNRFESTRFFDLRTQTRTGSSGGEWIFEDRVFRLPDKTARVEFHCALGMEGKIWFDAVSIEVAEGMPWLTSETKNFTFHWLAGSEYPAGSREYQQQLFDNYCAHLGVPDVDRPKINSYFYPDSATLFKDIGVRTPKKSYWDEAEVHSIYPVDDHEIIHIITKPYGVLPFSLTEGTAFYLMQEYEGRPVLEVAQELLKDDKLPPLASMLDPGMARRLNPDVVAPAAASFVAYLIEIGGPEKFLDLHREANAARTPEEFEEAFRRVYVVSAKDAEGEWKKLLRKLDFTVKAAPESTGTDTTSGTPGTGR